VSEGVPHLKQDHDFRRNDAIPLWRGFHACRRGLGTNLYRLGVLPKTIQEILRHSDVHTTESYYIKPTSTDADSGMDKFEQEISAQALRDSERTLKAGSGATPEFVN
jgi:integrase